jgi:tetratricopeptide (TPR) repeat protein
VIVTAAECVRRVRTSARKLTQSSAPLGRTARGSASAVRTSSAAQWSRLAPVAVEWTRRAGREAAQAAGTARATLARLAPAPVVIDQQREALRLNAAGAQHRRDGRYDEAVECHRRALELLRPLDDRRAVALTQSNLALALSHSGDDEWAIGLFEEAAQTLRELGDDEHEAQIMANLGLAHRRHGRREEGDNVLELALAKLSPESRAYHQIEEQLRRAS